MNRLVTSIAIILMLCLTAVVHAQSPAQNPRFLEAQQLESEGRTTEAAAIYEELYADNPNDLYYWKLITVYESAGMWEPLTALVRAQIDENPHDLEAHRYLFRALYGAGNREEARASLRRFAEGRWDDLSVITLITNELQIKGEFTDAANVYLQAREELENDLAYAVELALVYQNREQYLPALSEYIRVIDTHATAHARCSQVVSQAREAGIPADSLVAPVIAYLGDNPLSLKAAKLATGLLTGIGRHEDAFRLLRAPAAASGSYADIWNLAEASEQAGKADLAIDIYDEFCRSFPDNASCIRARMHAARLCGETGRIDDARRRYYEIITDAAGLYEASAAALRLIELSFDDESVDAYVNLLNGFAATSEHRETAYEAYLMLGDTLLRHDRPEEAGDAYTQAKLNARANHERYECSIRLAWFSFYTGAFDRLDPELQQAMSVAPDGSEINDLLALHILRLRCADEHDRDRFSEYAQGRYAAWRGLPDEAETLLETVATDTASVVGPAAVMALGQLYEDQGRPDDALDTYLTAITAAADTTTRVSAALAAATIAETIPGGEDRAKSLYLDMLSHYPGSVYDTELRTRLRMLTEP